MLLYISYLAFKTGFQKIGRITEDDDKTLFFIKCAHEMQDAHTVKAISSFTSNGVGKKLEKFEVLGYDITPVEYTALFEYISYMKDLHKLKFYNCIMEHLAFQE